MRVLGPDGVQVRRKCYISLGRIFLLQSFVACDTGTKLLVVRGYKQSRQVIAPNSLMCVCACIWWSRLSQSPLESKYFKTLGSLTRYRVSYL
jgi:hypothetical protein